MLKLKFETNQTSASHSVRRSVLRMAGTVFLLTASVGSSIALAQETIAPEGYSIRTIETPEGVRFGVTGLDIDTDGVVWVATRIGDVWYNQNGEWSQFASGLHEPTGLLRDDDGSIVVAQKPELTRLVDVDGDWKADEFHQITSGFEFHDNYHEYHYGPLKDARGYYYGALNLDHRAPGTFSLGAMGSSGGYRGWTYRVHPDGTFEPWASGMRSPAGMGMSPRGELFYIDNQGDWVGTSKLHLIEKGKFFGHPVSLVDRGFSVEHIRGATTDDLDRLRQEPVVWIPHNEVANSPGNPEWDTTQGGFGPFAGQIFVGDQTQSNIFRISLQKVKGVYQGMVVNFMNGFQSGNIRLRFHPDGSLWVGQTGRGWASKGGRPYGMQKVVWDGTNPFEIRDIKLTDTGFAISFTEELDRSLIDLDTVSVSRFRYPYRSDYGSPKTDVEHLDVQSTHLLVDRKTLSVKVPLMTGRVYEFEINRLRSASGRKVSVSQAFYTVNNLISP